MNRTTSQLRFDTALMFGAQTFYRLSGFVLVMALSRSLSPREIGVFFYGVSLAETVLLLANMNLNPSLVRRIASEPERTEEALGKVLGWRLVSAPLYLGGVALIGVLSGQAIWKPLLIAALFTLLEDIYMVFGAVFIARKRIRYNVSIGVPVQIGFLAALLIGLPRLPTLDFVLWVHLGRSAVLLGVAAWLCHWRLGRLRPRWEPKLLRENWRLTLLRLLALLQTRLDTLLLGSLTGYQAVGHYNLAARAVSPFDFVPSSFGQPLFPRFASEGPTPENRRELAHAIGWVVGIGILGAIFAGGGAVPLCHLLYGKNGAAVVPLLRGLALLMPLGFGAFLLTQALQALSQDGRLLATALWCTLLSLIANLSLIPFYGAMGAVGAQALVTIFRLLLLGRHYQQVVTRCNPQPP